MTVSNIQTYYNLPFEDYLKLDGISFSTIKSEGKEFKKTNVMQLGSSVDDYINHSERFTGDLKIVKPLAHELISYVGLPLYRAMEKQVSFTADFIYEGMVMKYKGRIDWFLQELIVIDTKVSKNILDSIKFFDYPNQLSGYAIVTKAKNAIILAVNPNPKNCKVMSVKVDIDCTWWERQVLKYGEPVR